MVKRAQRALIRRVRDAKAMKKKEAERAAAGGSDNGSGDERRDPVDVHEDKMDAEIFGAVADDAPSTDEGEEGVFNFSDGSDDDSEEELLKQRLAEFEGRGGRLAGKRAESSSDEAAEDGEDDEDENWGAKLGGYLGGDDDVRDLEKEAAEAKAYQQRLLAELENDDFEFDFGVGEADQQLETQQMSSDSLSSLSDRQKTVLIKERLGDVEAVLKSIQSMESTVGELDSLLAFCSGHRDAIDPLLMQIVRINKRILSLYLINAKFYLFARASCGSAAAMKDHPVVKRLAQLRKLLSQTEPQLEEIIRAVETFKSRSGDVQIKKILSDKKMRLMMLDRPAAVVADVEDNEEDVDMAVGEAKRGATSEMIKNKGLTAYRKKELKNPRVKHRHKWRKAQIKRRGQVREYREGGQMEPYRGERSGVKAGVVHSIKMKH